MTGKKSRAAGLFAKTLEDAGNTKPAYSDFWLAGFEIADGRGCVTLDHRERIDAKIGNTMGPTAIKLVIDRSANHTGVFNKPPRAGLRQHIGLRAVNIGEVLKNLPSLKPALRAPQPRRKRIKAQKIDPLRAEIVRDQRREIIPVHENIILKNEELAVVRPDEPCPQRVVARVGPELSGAQPAPFGKIGFGRIILEIAIEARQRVKKGP